MALKTFKPYTKSTRGTILVDRTGLWKGKPYKPLSNLNFEATKQIDSGKHKEWSKYVIGIAA